MNICARFCHRYLWPQLTVRPAILAGLILSGCVMTNGDVFDAPKNMANQQVIIGVPILLGGFGSAVPVTPNLQVTAKHVARYSWNRDVIYHPLCDLALIRTDSAQVPTWGLIFPDQPVVHQGHSLLGNSIEGKGKYLQDVIDTNNNCLYSLSDAPVMSGMSGGPVFNEAGEIVGITVAIVDNPEDLANLRPAARYSQFVPATLIFDWLQELGIRPVSASPALASAQVSPYVNRLNRSTDVPDSLGLPDNQNHSSNGLTPLVAPHNAAAASPLTSYATPVSGSFPPPDENSNDVALQHSAATIYQEEKPDTSRSPAEVIQNLSNDPTFR
ncbi:trypsin-like peptidase domain-containing protein [Photobacterium sp. WH24]|uniref:S1 family peptidase n=1 Tax=Photobacterium sp. WH24 TaxID=2827237 RepID=UPI001C43E9C1|nr:serine protease [Photobacterium sp. WH24]MBV7261220.1 trypsin-like peptidase domain-containing protein [Photobacterium sp. WH24]